MTIDLLRNAAAIATGGALVVSLLAAPSLAQDTAEDERPAAAIDETEEAEAEEEPASFFETVTVTATGTEVDPFDIQTSVSVLEAAEIERKLPESAADLLREQPGVDVNGVGPSQSRPIIRGQRGLRVLFLENGLRMNNPRRDTNFGEITSLVDIGNVERMEVVRGPASVLYGTDAIGGVLNLITKVPPYGDGSWIGGSLSFRYGSASEQEAARATVAGRKGAISFNLGFSDRDSEDYEAARGTFGDITLEQETTVVDTGLEDQSANAFLGVDLTENDQITLRYNRYRAEQSGFGFVEPEDLGTLDEGFRIRILYPFQDFDRITLGYRGSVLKSPLADSLEIQAYYQSNERDWAQEIDINVGPLGPGFPDSSLEFDTLNFTDLETLGLRAEVVRLAQDRHFVTYGAELYQDDSFNTDLSTQTFTVRFPFPPFEFPDVETDDVSSTPNAENTSYGVFVQDEISVTDRFKMTVGARYQNVETKAKATPGWDNTGLDFDDDAVVGAVSGVYQLSDNLRIVGSFGTAFRAPNIVERLFLAPTPAGEGFQIPNPDLVSEESENFDVGLKYRRRNATFELVYFRNDIEEGIIKDYLSQEEIEALPQSIQDQIEAAQATVVVQERNIDNLRYDGFEVIAGFRGENGIGVGIDYSHVDAKRLDAANPIPGDRSVSDKLNAYIRYEPLTGRYWVEYRLRSNGSEDLVLDPDESVPIVGDRIPGFTIHTLSGGVTLWEKGRQSHLLTLIIENLSDELYSEFSNSTFFRPQPKRSFIASYGLRF